MPKLSCPVFIGTNNGNTPPQRQVEARKIHTPAMDWRTFLAGVPQYLGGHMVEWEKWRQSPARDIVEWESPGHDRPKDPLL